MAIRGEGDMESDGIQQILKAEKDAAQMVSDARESKMHALGLPPILLIALCVGSLGRCVS